ncbi:MAG: hypothetical protein Q7K44_02380 [Candidatus Liptonbacteria bacterium]|nr:hypothetical protein [Candidatus Liptonbacteria bacterium]
MKIVNIPRPTPAIIKYYLEKWDKNKKYVLPEKSLKLLFQEAYPENKKIEHILIKVSCLNDFFNTHILSSFIMGEHILKQKIDKYLKIGNDEVVNKISKVKMPKGKIINFYSFASKYCSHHYPERYPIYDYYVERMLIHFKRQEKFYKFKRENLRDYPKFRKILEEFREFFGLSEYSLKDIDKYLWQAGKQFFPRNYKKQARLKISTSKNI